MTIQEAEDALSSALVATMGGGREACSTVVLTAHLSSRFRIDARDVDVRRHQPEHFVIRFARMEDRDRVLAS